MDIHKMRIFAESWSVAYRKKQVGDPFDQLEEPFVVIKNPFRCWAADPFLFEKDGDIYIFAELYDYLLARGTIGYMHLNTEKPRWVPVIRERYHLSFPYIYEINGEIFILPETNESKKLYRYRAVDFPDGWVKEDAIITDVRLVDTTPIQRYKYNLAITYDISDTSLKLIDLEKKTMKCLYSDDKGVRRPAGYISAEKGIRAAQECGEDYGKGILLYHFDLGQNQSYKEEVIKKVQPQDVILSKALYLDGMHTYNQSEHFEVIDIKTRRFNVLNFSVRLFRSFKKKRHTGQH